MYTLKQMGKLHGIELPQLKVIFKKSMSNICFGSRFKY